tara:strand:- start:1773 stop:3686 length:1914 start_codon:yes stop_codon:yes gene_type:complete
MAPKNQGILSFDPVEARRRAVNLLTTPRTQGLGQLYSQKRRPTTDKEFFDDRGIFTGGTIADSILRTMTSPVKGIFDFFKPKGGVLSSAGKSLDEVLDQESELGRLRRAEEMARRTGGLEIGLPADAKKVDAGTIFTMDPEDRKNVLDKAQAEAKDLIGSVIRKSRPDFGAFDPGMTTTTQADIDAVEKQAKEFQGVPFEEEGAGGVDADTEFPAVDTGTGEDQVEGADTPAKKATVQALDSFLSEIKTGDKVKPKTFDEYINEFGEATGLDISGEADTKQALMSFGLALMQNRAGKGFNISNILRATGEAGEAAMPDFRKAVAEAKAIRAKAGAYALGKTEKDKKEAMNRKAYFVIPKGDGSANSLSSAIASGQGRLARLNSYELNSLDTNPEFAKQFDIVDADYYKDYAKAALDAAGKNKIYQSKSVDVPLYAGAPKGLSFKAQLPDGNVAPAGTTPYFADSGKRVVGMIQNMERKVDYNAKEFEKLAKLLNTTNVTVLDQGRSVIKQTLRNFGINVGDTDPVKQIKVIMQRLQATNAAEILQESGKTLSDADRKFVREIVGDVNFLEGDEAVLRSKLSNLFNVIVKRGRENIKDAYNNLAIHGINIDNQNITAKDSDMVQGEDGVFRFKVQGTT